MRAFLSLLMVVLILIPIGIIFIAIDAGTGEVIATDTYPGVITNINMRLETKVINSGKTKIYTTNPKYYITVRFDNQYVEIYVSSTAYHSYYVGQNVTILRDTVKGNFTSIIYYDYTICLP